MIVKSAHLFYAKLTLDVEIVYQNKKKKKENSENEIQFQNKKKY